MEGAQVSGDSHEHTDREAAASPWGSAPASHRRGWWGVLFYAIVALTLVVLTVSILMPPSG